MCHHVYIVRNELNLHALVWLEFQLLVNFHNLGRGFQLSKQTKVSESNMADRVYISCLQTFILWIYKQWLAFTCTNQPKNVNFGSTIEIKVRIYKNSCLLNNNFNASFKQYGLFLQFIFQRKVFFIFKENLNWRGSYYYPRYKSNHSFPFWRKSC